MFIILLAFYILLSVGGLVFFKIGSSEIPILFSMKQGELIFQISVKSIIGLAGYVISFLLYMYLVSKYNLNYIAPIAVGASYILTIAASYFIFKEPFTLFQALGILLIFSGVVLMNLKK